VRVLFVNNFISHYRAPLFERLAQAVDVEYLFFSAGTEPYWQSHLGTTPADVRAETILGRSLGAGLNVNPRLVRELWTREYDVLVKCINGRLELASAYAIAKARRKPFVLWTMLWWHPVTLLGWLSQPALQLVYRGADAVVTDGAQVTRFLAGNGVAPEKVFTAECSVDNDRFMRPVADAERQALRASLGADGRPLVLAVARLVPEKGLDVLVRAAASLRDLDPVVAVVGTGPLGDHLRALAAEAGVELRLVGGVPPEAMPPYYAAADVFVMPSVTTPRVREPWGLGVNEAHCRRTPVVVTDAVGAAAGGLVVHAETGLVAPERDHEALAAALRRLLVDRPLARSLAAAGHERVKAASYDAMVESFVAAIECAAASRSAPRGARA
jgi:glycosyltransferase involved in cell wall biosynthesis